VSHYATSSVWRYARAKGTDLLTLLYLADCAQPDGRDAYPGVLAIANATRLSDRGTRYVLHRLEEAREIDIHHNKKIRRMWTTNKGHIFCPVWFIDVRCACDQATYLGEADPPPGVSEGFPEGRPEVRQRLPHMGPAKTVGRVRQSGADNRNGRSAKPEESRTHSTKEDPSPIRQQDPLEEQVQGLRPDSPLPGEGNPAENMRVIVKIAHTVLGMWPEELAVDDGEVVESIKRHCAVLHIAYNSAVVSGALESALVQRRRSGGSASWPAGRR
jgi:hypothetical protein